MDILNEKQKGRGATSSVTRTAIDKHDKRISKSKTFLSLLCLHRRDRLPAPKDSSSGQQKSRHDDMFGTTSATIAWDKKFSGLDKSIGQRATQTESINNNFCGQNKHQNPRSHRHLPQCDFIYDALVLTNNSGGQILRRLVVDFETDVNVMADDVQQALSARMDTYSGPAIKLPGRENVQPIGSVVARWKLDRFKELYQTTFLVIKNSRSDLLLGRISVKEHCLSRVDPEIAPRLNASYA